MFAKAKRPSGLRSCKRFAMASCGITLDTYDELLLIMLFFGFFLFKASFPVIGAKRVFSAPKAGALLYVPLEDGGNWASSPAVSWDSLDSFSLSLIL